MLLPLVAQFVFWSPGAWGPASDRLAWYADADADGFGDPGSVLYACAPPAGYVADATDCDDATAAVSPAADEVCDGEDDDCDGDVDETGATGEVTWFADADGDGFGDGDPVDACETPDGFVANDLDCDDTAPAVHPGAAEVCDDADNDCDWLVDEVDVVGATTWYADAYGDEYGVGGWSRAMRPPTPARTGPG